MAQVAVNLKTWIREAGERLGFALCGIAPAEVPAEDRRRYLAWLEEGFQGEMKYMERPQRRDLRELLPSVRSVICAAMVYNTPHPKSTACPDSDHAWISRYAWGEDYHWVLEKQLEKLLEELRGVVGQSFDAKIYVDTGPVLERALAQAAGLGWIAKNTCLIHPKVGSWFLVGEILTSLELEPDRPVADHCGTCTRCLDACPTQAIVRPYVLDATRCISYFTIELRGSIPEEFRPGLGRHVFGCDICQDVCPWNGKALLTELAAFQPRPLATVPTEGTEPTERTDPLAGEVSLFNPPLERLASLAEEEFRSVFKNSPIRRARYRGFLRNVAVAMGNSGQTKFRPLLERLTQHPDPLVQEHARWALNQLGNNTLPSHPAETTETVDQ